MEISSSPKLNCSRFVYRGASIDIKDVTVTNQKDYKLLAQYNLVFDEARANWIPFLDSITIENQLGMGIHCSLDENHEFLKIWIPKNSTSSEIELYSNEKLEAVISLSKQELENNCLISLFRPSNGNMTDGSLLELHANEANPHDDIFYTVFTGSKSFGLSKNYVAKLARNAEVVGNTYIDRNGRMQYLGDYL